MLNNFDKDEVKLANLLEKKDEKITREKLQDNIESYNKKINFLASNYKKISDDLKNDKLDEFEGFINFSKEKEEIKSERIKIDQENKRYNKILSNSKQFEKARWNTKGIIKILIEFLFKRSSWQSTKENLALIKNYNKGIKQIKQILKEYAKLSRQFENLEREYGYPGVSKKERHNKEREGEFVGIKSCITNKERFEEISNYTKTLIENISSEYKKNNEDNFIKHIAELASNQTHFKWNKTRDGIALNKEGKGIMISSLEFHLDALRTANKNFEEQNKEFQKLEHRNAGLIQKASDYFSGLTTRKRLKKSQKI